MQRNCPIPHKGVGFFIADNKLIDSGNRISAEIAARMMVQDYPSSATVKDFLARVMDTVCWRPC